MMKMGFKSKFFIVIFALVTLMFCLTACKVQTYGVTTFWDKGSIKLEANAASTGFLWICIIEDADMVELIREEIREPSSQIPGAMGGHQFDFKCNKEGKSNVVFELKKPWEEGEKPYQTKTYEFAMEGNRLKIIEII